MHAVGTCSWKLVALGGSGGRSADGGKVPGSRRSMDSLNLWYVSSSTSLTILLWVAELLNRCCGEEKRAAGLAAARSQCAAAGMWPAWLAAHPLTASGRCPASGSAPPQPPHWPGAASPMGRQHAHVRVSVGGVRGFGPRRTRVSAAHAEPGVRPSPLHCSPFLRALRTLLSSYHVVPKLSFKRSPIPLQPLRPCRPSRCLGPAAAAPAPRRRAHR
jgi:hypothetical protein